MESGDAEAAGGGDDTDDELSEDVDEDDVGDMDDDDEEVAVSTGVLFDDSPVKIEIPTYFNNHSFLLHLHVEKLNEFPI